MTKRNIVRLVLLAGVLAYFAYGYFRPKPDAVPHQTAAPIPTGAKEFTLGKLQFKSCELSQKRSGATTAAYCAPFQVAEDPDDAGSRKIDLNLALVKSDGEAADADIVVFLAGGPGQAAIETWPAIAAAFAPLRQRHHVLLLDQRGTGGSNALTCTRKADAEKSADEPADTTNDLELLRRNTRDCLAQVQQHADPRWYTTTVAAHDLEIVRQALGAPQFDLVGVSYGTRMAQQYARRHPDAVRFEDKVGEQHR